MIISRYFLEVSYKGAAYSGFQKQLNANTIQAEIEKAFFILQKNVVELTGSSRTDTGVNALQNFFHFDYAGDLHPHFVYKMNAILPPDIVVLSVKPVPPGSHCRFDATSRGYKYYIYQNKNPFLQDRAYYFPYTIDLTKMNEAAKAIKSYSDFTSFSKRRTQVKTFDCKIMQSEWMMMEENALVYHVQADRFLRGMVRGLTGTMLQVGRGKISVKDFLSILEARNPSKADFSVPGKGLFLVEIQYPVSLLK